MAKFVPEGYSVTKKGKKWVVKKPVQEGLSYDMRRSALAGYEVSSQSVGVANCMNDWRRKNKPACQRGIVNATIKEFWGK